MPIESKEESIASLKLTSASANGLQRSQLNAVFGRPENMSAGHAAPIEADGVTLRPSLAMPIGWLFLALFLGYLALVTVAVGGASAWWAYMPLAALASMSVWSALRQFGNRRRLALEVTAYSVCMGKSAVTRKEVALARHHSELMFKGVRIELVDGRWFGIPHHLHHPRKVLRALRNHGYPVTK